MDWPFKRMEVGEEVTYPMGTPEERALAKRAQKHAHGYARDMGMAFETKAFRGEMHIWREH